MKLSSILKLGAFPKRPQWQIKGEKNFKLTVPNKYGEKVCISYKVKGHKTRECKEEMELQQVFIVPRKAKNLKLECGGSVVHSLSKETEDLNCPLISFNGDLARRVCTTAWRPIFFWISITWLLAGLPTSWVLVHLFYKVKGVLHMRKLFRKRAIECEHCGEKINTLIEERDHEDCKDHICPYCYRAKVYDKNFKQHVRTCSEKPDFLNKIHSIVDWESRTFREMYNSVKVYQTCQFRLTWIGIFTVLFLLMFIPSVSSEYSNDQKCQHMRNSLPEKMAWFEVYCSMIVPENLIYAHKQNFRTNNVLSSRVSNYIKQEMDIKLGKKIGDDNSHLPPRSPTEEVTPPAPLPPLPVIPDLTIAVQILSGLFKMNVEELRNDILDAKKQVFNKITESEKNIGAGINSVSDDVQRSVNSCCVPGGSVDRCPECPKADESCPITINKVEYKDENGNTRQVNIRVHVEDSHVLMNILSNTANVQPGGRHDPSVGQNSVAVHGGSNQHVFGGSGGHNQVASGGSVIGQGQPATKGEEMKGIVDQYLNKYGMETIRERRTRSILTLDPQDEAQSKLLLDQEKVNIDRELNAENQRLLQDTTTDLESYETIVRGSDTAQKITNFHSKLPVYFMNSKAKLIDTHLNWFKFHKFDEVCSKNCLHNPNTCECVEEGLPDNKRLSLPWTTFSVDDIHFVVNPNMYLTAETTNVYEDEKTVHLKTDITGTMDVYEGSYLTWKLMNDETEVHPTISIIIPEISQVYSTGFIYMTCEREFDTEVKGVCTGGCGSYCNGRLCLGTRVWKWENCRKITCNPGWCWSTNDGCCCCGSNVYCQPGRKVAAVWKVKYVKTELLICVVYNDRMQSCRLVDGTTELNFGPVKVGVSSLLTPGDKLPNTIMSVHQTSTVSTGGMGPMYKISNSDEIYLDPPVCKNEASCNHGSIGDVQVNNASCLPMLGTKCSHDFKDLLASGCYNQVFVSHANSRMGMACHFAKHHTCDHEGLVKDLNFDSHLKNTEKLTDGFNIKKVMANLKEKSLLLYVSPKASSGTMNLRVEMNNIIVPKKEHPPKIEAFRLSNCQGCYSCHKGFTCTVHVEQNDFQSTILMLESKTPSVQFSKSPVSVKKGVTQTVIRGIAYEDPKTIEVCIMFGSDCLKSTVVSANLHMPTGQFIAVFDDTDATGSDGQPDKCVGFGWFSCAAVSVKSFFGNFWEFFKKAWYMILLLIIVLIGCLFLPQVLWIISSICRRLCRKSRNKRMYYQGPRSVDVYKELSTLNKPKKTSDDEAEEFHLLIDKQTEF